MASLQAQLDAAKALEEPAQAEAALRALVFEAEGADGEATKVKEAAIGALCDVCVKRGNAQALADLLPQLNDFFAIIPKAKTAKLVRGVIDAIAKIPGSTALQVQVCKGQVEWARAEKRTFLRQRIELRLASLYLDSAEYTAALAILGT